MKRTALIPICCSSLTNSTITKTFINLFHQASPITNRFLLFFAAFPITPFPPNPTLFVVLSFAKLTSTKISNANTRTHQQPSVPFLLFSQQNSLLLSPLYLLRTQTLIDVSTHTNKKYPFPQKQTENVVKLIFSHKKTTFPIKNQYTLNSLDLIINNNYRKRKQILLSTKNKQIKTVN